MMDRVDERLQNVETPEDASSINEQTIDKTKLPPIALGYESKGTYFENVSGVLGSDLLTIVDRSRSRQIGQFQVDLSKQMEDANRFLFNFNTLSQKEFETFLMGYVTATKRLKELKSHMDYVAKRIHIIEGLLNEKYPSKYEQASLNVEKEFDDFIIVND